MSLVGNEEIMNTKFKVCEFQLQITMVTEV